ncbi:hypothetical protein ASF45_27590 [Pseudorhodoferax sp. Leaf265]|nr:hypothetical protein ASF45_27590 [Pseudorhodoferax sp. Leaf265]
MVIEIFFIATSLCLALTIFRNIGKLPAVVVYLMLLFSPATFFMFDYALSDGFFACLNILALACSFELVFSQSWRRSFVSASGVGLTLGLMAVTRSEDPLIYLWGVFIVLAVWLSNRRMALLPGAAAPWWTATKLGGIAFVCALVVVQVVNVGHFVSSGVWTRSLAGMPSHMEFLRNMAKIDTGQPAVRFVPISLAARRLAYEASPTLRKISAGVEDDRNLYQVVSRANGIPAGEIGAGWIWHVFNGELFRSLKTDSALRLDQEFLQINQELTAAFSSGTLPRRAILHPFVTAPLGEIFTRLPESIGSVIQKTFQAYSYREDSAHEKKIFDAVTLRRSALVVSGINVSAQGWVFVDSPGRRVVSVSVRAADGESSASLASMERPDVVDGYAKEKGWAPSVSGFRVAENFVSRHKLSIVYRLDDGTEVLSTDGLTAGRVTELDSGGAVSLFQGIDYMTVQVNERVGWRHRVQALAVEISNTPVVSSALAVLFTLAVAVVLFFGRSLEGGRRVQAMLAFVVALFASRILFYGLMESEAWVVEARYMLSANFMCSIVLGLILAESIRLRRRARAGASRPL